MKTSTKFQMKNVQAPKIHLQIPSAIYPAYSLSMPVKKNMCDNSNVTSGFFNLMLTALLSASIGAVMTACISLS